MPVYDDFECVLLYNTKKAGQSASVLWKRTHGPSNLSCFLHTRILGLCKILTLRLHCLHLFHVPPLIQNYDICHTDTHMFIRVRSGWPTGRVWETGSDANLLWAPGGVPHKSTVEKCHTNLLWRNAIQIYSGEMPYKSTGEKQTSHCRYSVN